MIDLHDISSRRLFAPTLTLLYDDCLVGILIKFDKTQLVGDQVKRHCI